MFCKRRVKTMASDDVYLRKDVYAADQRAIIAEMQRGNSEVLRVLEQFRSENKAALEQLRSENKAALEQLRSENKAAISELRTDMNDRFNQVDTRIGKLEAQVVVLSGRVRELERSMTSMHSYWIIGISFVSLVIVIATVLQPMLRYIRMFWKPKPTITREQIEALIDAKLSTKQ